MLIYRKQTVNRTHCPSQTVVRQRFRLIVRSRVFVNITTVFGTRLEPIGVHLSLLRTKFNALEFDPRDVLAFKCINKATVIV